MGPRVPTFSESQRHTLQHEHFKRLASSRRADGSPKRDPLVCVKKNFENAIKQQGFRRISILNQSTTPMEVPLNRAKRSVPFNVENIKKHKLSSKSVIKAKTSDRILDDNLMSLLVADSQEPASNEPLAFVLDENRAVHAR